MEKLTRKDVTTKWTVSGIQVSAMVNGHRKACTYYGYTKSEAIKIFLEEVNKGIV